MAVSLEGNDIAIHIHDLPITPPVGGEIVRCGASVGGGRFSPPPPTGGVRGRSCRRVREDLVVLLYHHF